MAAFYVWKQSGYTRLGCPPFSHINKCHMYHTKRMLQRLQLLNATHPDN